MTNITNPGNVPVLTDAQWIDAWPEPEHSPPGTENMPWRDQPDSAMVRIVQNRHDEKQNMLFADGSSTKIGLKQIWTLKWHKEYNTGGKWTVSGGVTYDDWPSWMAGFKEY